MRVAITGSRQLNYNHMNKVKVEGTNKYIGRSLKSILDGMYFDLFEDGGNQLIFIEGGAPGTDTMARDWCKARGVMYEEYPADWKKHGKAAGPIRNQKMAERCDYCLAFPIVGLENKGTMDMIEKCEKLGKHVDVYWMEI